MIDRAEARDAISKLIYGYAEALDGGDLERVGAYFEHAVILAAAGEIRGGAAAREMYRGWTRIYDEQGRSSDWGRPGATPHTRHLTSNLMIDLAEDGRTASARCSVVVFMSLPGFPLQPILRGGYCDRFECVDGRWRFSERRMLVDDVGDLSQHLKQALA